MAIASFELVAAEFKNITHGVVQTRLLERLRSRRAIETPVGHRLFQTRVLRDAKNLSSGKGVRALSDIRASLLGCFGRAEML